LFLPKEWIADPERCRLAGIAHEVAFATRPVLAQRMIDRALQAQVPFGWVTEAQAWGRDSGFRMWLEARDIAYVLGLPSGGWRVSVHGGRRPLTHRTPCDDWRIVDVRKIRRQGWTRSLLTRRSVNEPAEMAGYVCFAPVETTVEELAWVAEGQRSIGECLRMARRETGLDQYQARSHQAWYRHVTLAMVAAAFLMITHAR
jgi:SRSO17 transposase